MHQRCGRRGCWAGRAGCGQRTAPHGAGRPPKPHLSLRARGRPPRDAAGAGGWGGLVLAEGLRGGPPMSELHVPPERGACEQTRPLGRLTSGQMELSAVAQGQPLPRAACEGRTASVRSAGKLGGGDT